MHSSIQVNPSSPGSTVWTASEGLKHSFSLTGQSNVLLEFFCLFSGVRAPCPVCLYPHRSSTVGKPDTRKQRAPHSFTVYDGNRQHTRATREGICVEENT